MRLALAASALSLSALGLGFLTQTAQPDTAPRSVPAPASVAAAAPVAAPASVPAVTSVPAAAPAATVSSPAPAASEAAAKHLKRTACLKEAKTKKLIGAEKTAFLKSCIEAPQEPISASRRILPERP
jgi:hypothetical protein